MKKSGSQKSKSPSQLIDARIKELVSRLRSEANNSSVFNAEIMNTYIARTINRISETGH
jgi:hypothetical protein